jgi:hypothetical protein
MISRKNKSPKMKSHKGFRRLLPRGGEPVGHIVHTRGGVHTPQGLFLRY